MRSWRDATYYAMGSPSHRRAGAQGGTAAQKVRRARAPAPLAEGSVGYYAA
ncbi:hypothetical protein GCM10020001_090280 [Nonomuraea salmonea]